MNGEKTDYETEAGATITYLGTAAEKDVVKVTFNSDNEIKDMTKATLTGKGKPSPLDEFADGDDVIWLQSGIIKTPDPDTDTVFTDVKKYYVLKKSGSNLTLAKDKSNTTNTE